MRHSSLMIGGVVTLLLAAPSASALESCYQICNPSVSCSTPCVDPYRPYLGPLACGAGFQCSRGAFVSNHDGISTDEGILFSDFKPEQAACQDGRGDGSLFLPSSSPQEPRVAVAQPGH